jgi:hypothetical protein
MATAACSEHAQASAAFGGFVQVGISDTWLFLRLETEFLGNGVLSKLAGISCGRSLSLGMTELPRLDQRPPGRLRCSEAAKELNCWELGKRQRNAAFRKRPVGSRGYGSMGGFPAEPYLREA